MTEFTTLVALTVVGFFAGMLINYALSKLVFKSIFNKKVANKIQPKPLFIFEIFQNLLSFAVGYMFVMLPLEQFILLMTAWIALQVVLAIYIFKFSRWSHGLTFAGCDTLTDVIIGAVSGVGTTMKVLQTLALLTVVG